MENTSSIVADSHSGQLLTPKNREVSSLYLHFPFCRHLCNFCDFYKTLSPSGTTDFSSYYKYLELSMEKLKFWMGEKGFRPVPLETLYIGGGTPSLWGTQGPAFLRDFFLKYGLELRSDCEFTLEVDPGAWTADSILEWARFGANRFSLGIQTFDAGKLVHLDRGHTIEDSKKLLAFFQGEKLNFSVDMLMGIPNSDNQTLKRDILLEVKELLAYGPRHMSFYLLTTTEGYPAKALLPSDDFTAEEFLSLSSLLQKAGMAQYEVSNYAFPGYESRHNKRYWEFKSMMALGQSATGILVCSGSEATRFKWKTNLADFVLEELNEREIKLEKVYLGLRTKVGLRVKEFFDQQDVNCIEKLIIGWQQQGFIQSYVEGVIRLSAPGLLVLDSLMSDLFREVKGL